MLGISLKNVDPNSFLSVERELLVRPGAADADYFSSASDGGAQAAFGISSAVVGTEIFRSATGKRPLMIGRRLTVTKTDNSGTNLAVTVRLFYRRFGVLKYKDVVCNGSGTETVDSGICADELASNPKIVAIANQAASDTVSIGYDAKWVGLARPVRGYDAIRMVLKVTSSTPDVAGPKYGSDITSAMFDAAGSALDAYTLYANTTLTANDDLVVEYLSGGLHAGRETIKRGGLRFY